MSNDKTTELLRNLIHDVNASGGLIDFSDGLSAPKADPSWVDLGSRVEEIDEHLKSINASVRLKRDSVDFPSEEAFEHL